MNRILLIDDDIDDAGLFREALKRVDPSVSLQYFCDGDEALRDMLEQKNHLPDIIFLDINMPKTNGWQYLTKFREEQFLKYVPVIMYTTSSEVSDLRKSEELGANGLVTKPDDFDQLKKILTSILAAPIEQLAKTLQNISGMNSRA